MSNLYKNTKNTNAVDIFHGVFELGELRTIPVNKMQLETNRKTC